MEQLAAFEGFEALHLEPLGHERAHAGGDEHRPRPQLQALLRGEQETPVVLARQRLDLVAQMQRGLKGRHLAQQRVGEFLAAADGQAGDVVDRLVGVELARLAAGVRQRVDDVGVDFQQAQLEHLPQAHRAGADHHGVGVDGRGGGAGAHDAGAHARPVGFKFNSCLRPPRLGWRPISPQKQARAGRPAKAAAQRLSSGSLPVLSFHSSASGSGSLRLVMVFQFGSRASSALMAVMWIWSLGRSSSA